MQPNILPHPILLTLPFPKCWSQELSLINFLPNHLQSQNVIYRESHLQQGDTCLPSPQNNLIQIWQRNDKSSLLTARGLLSWIRWSAFNVVLPGGLPINGAAPGSARDDLMSTSFVHMWNCQNEELFWRLAGLIRAPLMFLDKLIASRFESTSTSGNWISDTYDLSILLFYNSMSVYNYLEIERLIFKKSPKIGFPALYPIPQPNNVLLFLGSVLVCSVATHPWFIVTRFRRETLGPFPWLWLSFSFPLRRVRGSSARDLTVDKSIALPSCS